MGRRELARCGTAAAPRRPDPSFVSRASYLARLTRKALRRTTILVRRTTILEMRARPSCRKNSSTIYSLGNRQGIHYFSIFLNGRITEEKESERTVLAVNRQEIHFFFKSGELPKKNLKGQFFALLQELLLYIH